jgi:hypothetical protein
MGIFITSNSKEEMADPIKEKAKIYKKKKEIRQINDSIILRGRTIRFQKLKMYRIRKVYL